MISLVKDFGKIEKSFIKIRKSPELSGLLFVEVVY